MNNKTQGEGPAFSNKEFLNGEYYPGVSIEFASIEIMGEDGKNIK